MKTIAVVVPVFLLKDDRLLNFLFNIKHLHSISDRCEVIVSEQIHPDNDISSFLKIYSGITHLRFELGDVFNKSILINRAFQHTSSDYFWVIDADYYTNYEYVVDSVDKFTTFTRPHSDVILLNTTETEHLIESGYVQITRDSYESSSANGKYSFIVSSDEFTKSGMMNENFLGWGFQDLDFIENRLTTTDISNLNVLGFHLYHPPASKKYMNDNKLLYMGIYSSNETEEPTPKIHKMIVANENSKSQNQPIDNNKSENDENIKMNKLKHIHIYFHSRPYFGSEDEPELIEVKTSSSVKRQPSGILKGTLSGYHYIFYYAKYIIENYSDITGVIMFSTDFYAINRRIYNSTTKKDLIAISKSDFSNFGNFQWVGATEDLKTRRNFRYNQSDYEKFNMQYSSNLSKKPNFTYSRIGSFLISANAIKSKPVEFYKEIYNKRTEWKEFECLYMMATLKNIFS